MEHKYNDQRIADYSSRLARQLTDSYFLTNTSINGRELLTFSPIRQINLFILKDLLSSWHQEFAKLQSPYFDYEAEEVTQSLGQFMNVLSQHILIKRQDFEPLLKRAITNTINWATRPVTTFEQVFLEGQDKVNVDDLRAQLKYLDQDKAPMLEFLDNLHTNDAEPSFILSRLKLFVSAHYRDMSSADELFARLNQLLPLQANELRDTPEAAKPTPAPQTQAAPVPSQPAAKGPEPEKAAPIAPAPASASVPASSSPRAAAPVPAAPPKPAEAPQAEPPKPAAEAPKPEPAKAEEKPKPLFTPLTPPAPAVEKTASVQAPAGTPSPKPESAPAAKPAPVEATAPKLATVAAPTMPTAPQPQAAPEKPLVERLRTERSSLNETLKPAETGSIAAAHGSTKIESLKNSISINQRFAFINELFGGDNQAYQQSLGELDQKPDLNSAKAFVENDLANRFDWKNKVDTVNKLLRLLERKFS